MLPPSHRFGPFRIGSRSAAVCIKGVVYYMYYARPCDHRLVSPAAAGVIPWERLKSIEKSAAGAVSMCFYGKIEFPDHALLNCHIVLKKSRFHRSMRLHCAERRRILRKDASDSDALTD